MRSFKQYLRENEDVFKSVGWDYSNTRAYIDKISDYSKGSWFFTENSEGLQTGGNFKVINEMLRETGLEGILPIPNYVFAKSISIQSTELKTFLNFPPDVGSGQHVVNDLASFSVVSHNPGLTSLEHVPAKILGNAYLTQLRDVSFSRCDRYLQEIQGRLTIGSHYFGPILSVLKIKKLKAFDFSVSSMGDDDKRLINKIMARQLQGERDILDCKEELIAQGLKEYAKL